MGIVSKYDEQGRLVAESGPGWLCIYSPDGECRVRLGERPDDLPPPLMVREVKHYRITVEEIQ